MESVHNLRCVGRCEKSTLSFFSNRTHQAMLTPSTITSTRSTITQGTAIATISAHVGSEEEEEEEEVGMVGRREGDGVREEVGVVEEKEGSGGRLQGLL